MRRMGEREGGSLKDAAGGRGTDVFVDADEHLAELVHLRGEKTRVHGGERRNLWRRRATARNRVAHSTAGAAAGRHHGARASWSVVTPNQGLIG